MTFEKGKSGNPAGRAKGVPTKQTARFKDALNELLESQADKMVLWLEEIEDPKDRFNVLKDFAEYIHPKLARSEIKHEGELSIGKLLAEIDEPDKTRD